MSLYRKYRPQTFEDVVGQEHVARTLRNALTSNPPRVAHAYLFTGPRGIGKTTNARLLAKCLNCENGPTPIPCNNCDFCNRVATNQPTMDLVEIDAASTTQVEKIRETILDNVGSMPAQGRYKIYIIDEVHMLSLSSFNALLKTLEEPPAHAIFVLATTETHKVPATVLSRCQRFDFRRVTPPDIAKRLQYVADCEKITLADEAAKLIARHADGALRDALTLLEQVIAFSGENVTASDVRLVVGGVPQELIDGLMENVAQNEARAVLELIGRAVDEGASFGQLSRDLAAYARDLLLLTVGFAGDDSLSDEEKANRARHAEMMGRPRLEAFLTAVRDAEKEMRTSSDHRLLLELTLIRASEGLLSLPTPVSAPAAPRPVAAWRKEAPKIEEKSANIAPISPRTEEMSPNIAPVSPDTEEIPADINIIPAGINVIPEEIGAIPEESEPEIEVAAPKKRGRRISNFEELVELWPKVLMRVRKKIGIPAVSYLADAQPVDFTDDSVILQFSKEFHHAKAVDAFGRLPFEAVINETLDKPRHLRLQLEKPVAKIVETVEETDDDDDDDDLFGGSGNIVEYTQRVFGADIVGRSG